MRRKKGRYESLADISDKPTKWLIFDRIDLCFVGDFRTFCPIRFASRNEVLREVRRLNKLEREAAK